MQTRKSLEYLKEILLRNYTISSEQSRHVVVNPSIQGALRCYTAIRIFCKWMALTFFLCRYIFDTYIALFGLFGCV